MPAVHDQRLHLGAAGLHLLERPLAEDIGVLPAEDERRGVDGLPQRPGVPFGLGGHDGFDDTGVVVRRELPVVGAAR
nr:hypothetical protein [Natronomonas salina]